MPPGLPSLLDLARAAPPVTPDELARVVREHRRFYSSGGGGGRWQTVDVAGMTMAVYRPSVTVRGGTQADLSRRCLEQVDLSDATLPFANLVGVLARGVSARGAHLHRSCVTDGDWSGACFDRADLRGCDFSRTRLAGCSFRGAQLDRCDFEGADLTGADLAFADLGLNKWAGARVEGITGLTDAQLDRIQRSAAGGGDDGAR